jgi:hypothetical protein
MFRSRGKLKFLQDTIVPVTTLKNKNNLLFVPLQIQTKTHYLPFSFWNKKNSLGFDISEVAFVNWSAGGTSSISGLFKGKFHRVYSRSNYNWSNELIVKYGLNKQDGIAIRKQKMPFNSIRLLDIERHDFDLVSFSKIEFQHSIYQWFTYPNTEKAISKPLLQLIFYGSRC